MAETRKQSSQFNSRSPTIRRILREASEIAQSPSPDYFVEPLENDLFEWHFTLRGPPGSAYSEGIYHGRILLPPAYPLRPPSFRFTTPSGRFESNREICLSISDHHEETWQPAWGIRTALVAIRLFTFDLHSDLDFYANSPQTRLRSFMVTDAQGQLGGLDTTDAVRHRLARDSGSFRCSACGRSNADILAESAKRASELGSSSEMNSVQVPGELSLSYRDDMIAKTASTKAPKPGGTAALAKKDDSETAELAEAFVQTSSSSPQASLVPNRPTPADSSQPSSSSAAKSASPPGSSASAYVPQGSTAPQRNQAGLARHDEQALWIDRAIVALVLVLIAVLLRVAFSA